MRAISRVPRCSLANIATLAPSQCLCPAADKASAKCQALDLLNRAKQLTTADAKFGEPDDRKKLLAITYNNMSCIYKRRGLFKTALGFAEKALKLETSSSKADNPACTHLNLCAILSRLDRHRHALEHCQCALTLLKGEGYTGGVTPGLVGKRDNSAAT